MLFYMAIAELQMRLLIGDCREPDERAIDERVDYAVRLFLDGARAPVTGERDWPETRNSCSGQLTFTAVAEVLSAGPSRSHPTDQSPAPELLTAAPD